MAEILKNLAGNAVVVNGPQGLDEAGLKNSVAILKMDRRPYLSFQPEDIEWSASKLIKYEVETPAMQKLLSK